MYELCGQRILYLRGGFLVTSFVEVNLINMVLLTKWEVEKISGVIYWTLPGCRFIAPCPIWPVFGPISYYPEGKEEPWKGRLQWFVVNVSSPRLLLQCFSKSKFTVILRFSWGSEQWLCCLIKMVYITSKPCCINGRRNRMMYHITSLNYFV